jgi:F-type H+-transporting ATPase subunit b
MRLARIMLPATAAGLLLSPGVALASDSNFTGDAGQSIAAIVVFLLLLVVLGKWAWKPIVKQLQLREDSIANQIQEAQRRQKEAQELLEQYKAQLAAAQKEVEELLSRGRREAAQAREQIVAAARDEGQKAIDHAGEDIEQAKRTALRELYETTAMLAVDVAGKIIKKTLQPQDHRDLVEQSLQEIRSRAGDMSSPSGAN